MVINIRKNDSQQSLLSGVTNIDVEPTNTVVDVKRFISHVMPGKLSPENLILHFDGKLLQDKLTLGDYGVGPLSTLLLSEILIIRIQIRWLSGETKTIPIKVRSMVKCGDIRQAVMMKEHLSTIGTHYTLCSSDGSYMQWDKPINECNIENGSLLNLIRKSSLHLQMYLLSLFITLQLQKRNLTEVVFLCHFFFVVVHAW